MKKYQAGGVAHKKVTTPMVDPKGAFTKVQERTLKAKNGACMKCGGRVKAKKK